jgi:hypothetical protein
VCGGQAPRRRGCPGRCLGSAAAPPRQPEEVLDPRSVGSPALIAAMLAGCDHVGRRQGPRFSAFFGCMYYAMMRPSEVAALTRTAAIFVAEEDTRVAA